VCRGGLSNCPSALVSEGLSDCRMVLTAWAGKATGVGGWVVCVRCCSGMVEGGAFGRAWITKVCREGSG